MAPLQFLRENYLSQPFEVAVELSAVCNARCTFCPYPTIDRKGTVMPIELVHRLIDEMAAWPLPTIFSPFKINEPLLNKNFGDVCRRFNERCPDSHIRIFTNGSPMTPARVDEIAELTNVEHLWISLNTHDAADYERIMGLDFARTTSRLDELHARDGFPHPVIVSKVGVHGAQDFRAYVSRRWPKFQAFIVKLDRWISFTDADYPTVPDRPCSRWFELSIMANGLVSHCCMADGTDSRWNIGDVSERSMLDVYNSPFWRERREMMVSRKALDQRSPCAQCSY